MVTGFADKLLYYVARMIIEKEPAGKKLFDRILEDCFPGQRDNPNIKRLVQASLEHLLNPPGDEAPFIRFLDETCSDCQEKISHCIDICPVDAIYEDMDKKKHIDYDLCIECGQCVKACVSGSIVARSEFAQVAKMLIQGDGQPVFAVVAPSFVGQFGEDVAPEQVKGALRLLGFNEVFEVALAADIVTHLEAQEFLSRHARKPGLMITSCCCPAFINLVEKHKPRIANLVSNSVSPMIAIGRLLKARYPNCRVVFIGPCIAKKNEARKPDLQPAIDCVLTFRETQIMLEAAGLSALSSMPELPLEDASHDGRIFAHTGGVTEAIAKAIRQLDPDVEVIAVQGNGIKECNRLLEQAEQGMLQANFMEGMGCPNGCVGGPGTIIPSERGAEIIDRHAKSAPFSASFTNNNALKWLDEYPSKERLLSPKRS